MEPTSYRPGGDNAVWKVMDVLERQPVLTSRLVEEELRLARNTAWHALTMLEDAGILRG